MVSFLAIFTTFGHFHGFQSRKEGTYFSASFSNFHEFENKQQGTYCPISGYLHEFEGKKSVNFFTNF